MGNDKRVTDDLPLVSVVMPAYNDESFIGRSIESVQAQTFTNWELIIVDDASTDRTGQLIETYARQDKRIVPVRNEHNLGTAASRNKAFSLCRGQYVALLDSDDLWKPDKLKLQIEKAQQSGADLVYCSYEIIDEEGVREWKDFIVPETTSFTESLSQSVMSCSTTLLKREIVERYRMRTDIYHEDLLYWLLLLKEGKKAVGIPQVLASYRIRRNSRASNKVRSAYYRWKVYRLLRVSFFLSVISFVRYVRLGLKKYEKAS